MVVNAGPFVKETSRINSSQVRFLRSLSGFTLRDRIKREKIRKQWKVEEIIDDIQNYQHKWNQHVLRMPENRYHANHCNINPKAKEI